MISKFQRDA